MKLLDWLVRVGVLVLSALATLALIGSLASVSNTPLGDAFPGKVASAPPADPVPEPTPAPPFEGAAAPGEPVPATAAEVREAITRAESDGSAEIARWLKALTYALLALGGFAAAGVVALMRIAWHLGRITPR